MLLYLLNLKLGTGKPKNVFCILKYFLLLGHEDVVRSLAVLSKYRFLSAANDFMIRLWDIDSGACLQRYSSLSGEYIYRYIRLP